MGLMEEKLEKNGREMVDLILRESNMREQM